VQNGILLRLRGAFRNIRKETVMAKRAVFAETPMGELAVESS